MTDRASLNWRDSLQIAAEEYLRIRLKVSDLYNAGESDPATDEYKAMSSAMMIAIDRYRELAAPREVLALLNDLSPPTTELPPSINTNELLEAAKTLVLKLDQINADPAFVGVFQMASIHGAPYGGPSWVSELDALRTAISNAEKA